MSDGRIVAGFDGSASAWRALDWAIGRAAQRGDALDVVFALDTRFGSAAFGPSFDLAGTVEAELRQAETHLTARAPSVRAHFGWVDGPAAGALVHASAGAALLVVGTDKRPGQQKPRIGSLPLHIAAKADCAVAVIPHSPAPDRKAVVVGIDRSSYARSALALAVTEASWRGAALEAVHAWDVPELFQRALDDGKSLDPAFVEAEQRVIPDAVADVPLARSASITPYAVRQNPAAALIERGTGAELLVLGTRGRGRFAASMLGSVSHDVLVNIPCPVIVTPKEYSFVGPDGQPEQTW
ncbi:MAG TPA: universal stress protein [Leifsonia sp.]